MEAGEQPLTADEIHERMKNLKPGTLYRMAAAGQIPCLHVGTRKRGKRFFLSEVVEALRTPVELPAVKRAKTDKATKKPTVKKATGGGSHD